jgi:hypothetical protein
MKLLFAAFMSVFAKDSATTFQWQNISNVVKSGTKDFKGI